MLIKFSILVLSLLIASYTVPGITVVGLYPAIVVATFFVVARFTIKPLLVLLTLPVHVLTLGLSSFFINAFILWLLATFVSGFSVSGVVAALLGALIIALGHMIGELIT